MTHEDKLMQWFKEHNVDNLNKTLTRQNEPIVIYDLDEFMDGQKLEDSVNVTLPYGVLRKLTEESQKLDKYNSELCMELTITIDKLCLAEKEIERLKVIKIMKKYNKISIAFSLVSIFVSILSTIINLGFILAFISIGLLLTGLLIFVVGLLFELNRGDNK